MSQCGDYEDINFYVINVFYGIVIDVYFLPFKKNHPVHKNTDIQSIRDTSSPSCEVTFQGRFKLPISHVL